MKKITDILSDDLEDENVDKPGVQARAELVPYSPTAEVKIAFDDFVERLREAMAISPADWPKGRTFELSLGFSVVPTSINAKFGQK